jgi:hypothetical protein
MDVHQYVLVETARSVEEMAQRLIEIQTEQGEKGNLLQSVSHTVNHENENGPYEFIVVARSALPNL